KQTVLSSKLPEATRLPSGAKATEKTRPLCPVRVRSASPVAQSQRQTLWFHPPETRSLPLGEHATEETSPGQGRRRTSFTVPTSQTRTVWSRLAEATILSPDAKATLAIMARWPVHSWSCFPVSAAQTRRMLSWPPVASSFPLGE